MDWFHAQLGDQDKNTMSNRGGAHVLTHKGPDLHVPKGGGALGVGEVEEWEWKQGWERCDCRWL